MKRKIKVKKKEFNGRDRGVEKEEKRMITTVDGKGKGEREDRRR